MKFKAFPAALAVFFCFSAYAATDESVVSIGVVAPLTGDQAYIGTGVQQGVQMAVEDANIKGPVFGNTKLKVLPLDDQHNPTQAVLAANKFAADSSVVAVVGHFNSSCSKAASSIYHEARLAQISPGSTNPEISKQGYDTFFRVCATDDVQAPAGADFIFKKLGLKKIILIDDQTTYGKGLADELDKRFKSLGGEVLFRSGITQGEKDFTPLLTKVKSMKPELVFYGGVYPELALLLKQAKKIGLSVPWMGGDGIFDVTLIQLAGASSEGVYSTMIGVDPHSLPAAQDFVARYEARYGEIGSYSSYAYDATNILIEAIRKAGRPDREAVLKEVHATKDFPGILGPVNFDANGDAIGKSIGIFQVQGGKFVFLQEVGA